MDDPARRGPEPGNRNRPGPGGPIRGPAGPARLLRSSALPLAALLISLLLAGFASRWNLVDDAFILCRFAANAAAGHGIVYNPGQPFESHSSPLWVALLAPAGRAGLDLPWFSRALGVLSALLLVLLVAATGRRLFPPALALVLSLVVAGDRGLAVWSISGLETAGFTLLVLAGLVLLLAALRSPSRGTDLVLGGTAGLLALARPEGIAVGGLLVGVRFLGPGRGSAVAGLLSWLLVLGALTAWRLDVYGDWLPGSVRGKWIPRLDAAQQGAGMAGLFFLRRLPLVAGSILAVVAAWRAGIPVNGPRDGGRLDPAARLAILAGFLVVLLFTVMMVAAGGDWMGTDRLMLPALPILALLSGFGWMSLRPGAGGDVRPLLLFLAAMSLAGASWQADAIPGHNHAARRLGAWLARQLPDSTLLGVAAAGAIPYDAGLPAIDALGITDPATARTPPAASAPWKPGHMRYDLDRFLAAEPGVIVWEFGADWSRARMAESPPDRPQRRGDYRRELLRHPEFRAHYRPMPGVPPEAERYFSVFRRVR